MTKDAKIKALQKVLSSYATATMYVCDGKDEVWICCDRNKKAGHKKSCKVGRLLA